MVHLSIAIYPTLIYSSRQFHVSRRIFNKNLVIKYVPNNITKNEHIRKEFLTDFFLFRWSSPSFPRKFIDSEACVTCLLYLRSHVFVWSSNRFHIYWFTELTIASPLMWSILLPAKHRHVLSCSLLFFYFIASLKILTVSVELKIFWREKNWNFKRYNKLPTS